MEITYKYITKLMLLQGLWRWELVEESARSTAASTSECARNDFLVCLLDMGKAPGGIGEAEEMQWGETDGQLAAGDGVGAGAGAGGFSSTSKLGLLIESAVRNKRTLYSICRSHKQKWRTLALPHFYSSRPEDSPFHMDCDCRWLERSRTEGEPWEEFQRSLEGLLDGDCRSTHSLLLPPPTTTQHGSWTTAPLRCRPCPWPRHHQRIRQTIWMDVPIQSNRFKNRWSKLIRYSHPTKSSNSTITPKCCHDYKRIKSSTVGNC